MQRRAVGGNDDGEENARRLAAAFSQLSHLVSVDDDPPCEEESPRLEGGTAGRPGDGRCGAGDAKHPPANSSHVSAGDDGWHVECEAAAHRPPGVGAGGASPAVPLATHSAGYSKGENGFHHPQVQQVQQHMHWQQQQMEGTRAIGPGVARFEERAGGAEALEGGGALFPNVLGRQPDHGQGQGQEYRNAHGARVVHPHHQYPPPDDPSWHHVGAERGKRERGIRWVKENWVRGDGGSSPLGEGLHSERRQGPVGGVGGVAHALRGLHSFDLVLVILFIPWFSTVAPPHNFHIEGLSMSDFPRFFLWTVCLISMALPTFLLIYARLVRLIALVLGATLGGERGAWRACPRAILLLGCFFLSHSLSEDRKATFWEAASCVGECGAAAARGGRGPEIGAGGKLTAAELVLRLEEAEEEGAKLRMREQTLEQQVQHLRKRLKEEQQRRATDVTWHSRLAASLGGKRGWGGGGGGDDSLVQEMARRVGEDQDQEAGERREAVKSAFVYAWAAYEDQAFGWDELRPLSRKGHNYLSLGVTIVDSLDTLLIMGMHETETYKRAREWVRDSFNPQPLNDVSVFESTIRVLGGLLGAFALTADDVYRSAAVALADRLVHCFETPTGIPSSVINLAELGNKTVLHNPFNGQTYRFGDATTVAEAGSLQLEFAFLSHITGDPRYAEKADRALEGILGVGLRTWQAAHRNVKPPTGGDGGQSLDGVVFPVDIHPRENKFAGERVSMGSGGDSFYEYLLKQPLQRPRSRARLRKLYREVIDTAVARSSGWVSKGKRFVGESQRARSGPLQKMEHLACFLPGMLALGHATGASAGSKGGEGAHLGAAEEIMRVCMEMYTSTETGLSAESYETAPGKPIKPQRTFRYSLLRPEAVESAFLLWRVTKHQRYRDFGWDVFRSLEKWSRLPGGRGYTAVADVGSETGASELNRLDRMDSFLLSETLKYLYLLFCPDTVLPLDKYVLNTEAHPFPVQE